MDVAAFEYVVDKPFRKTVSAAIRATDITTTISTYSISVWPRLLLRV